MARRDIFAALVATSEVTGFRLPAIAVKEMVRALECYTPESIAVALKRCQHELTGRLTLKAILDRIEGQDGRPGAEQAWGMCPRDEETTVVWTTEMCEAFGVAALVLDTGDKVAARMTFKESYERLVREARERKEPVRWTVSLGTRIEGRGAPVLEAVKLGRLEQSAAERIIGGLPDGERVNRELSSGGMSTVAQLMPGVYDDAASAHEPPPTSAARLLEDNK